MSASPPAGITRREWLEATARLGLATAAYAATPADVFSQPAMGKDPRLISRSVRPPNLETPVALLDDFLTRPSAFFVRSHMLPPSVEEDIWALTIDGDVGSPVTLSMADLRRMPLATITATVECAGNGRAFFDPSVAGIQWSRGAVGTARWTGVPMGYLMDRAGVRRAATHVWMSGGDRPLGVQPPFVRQVPIAKALDPSTLVAYAMNDQPLPPLHGYPIRVVVPGWEGAYSVKWLNRLTAATREHDGFWVATAYRYPTMRVAPGASVDPKNMAPLTGLVVKSLITRPLEGSVVSPGLVRIAGFAWAGERDITRVEVSIDAGASWRVAQLTGARDKYTWRRFEYGAELTRREVYTLVSRATDSRGQTQPIVPSWNPSGYSWNAPDVVRVEVRS